MRDGADMAAADPYRAFLERKIRLAEPSGFEPPAPIHPWLKPHAAAITRRACLAGCHAIFAAFGLHKTSMELEWARQVHLHTGGPTLQVLPLGVRHGFVSEAAKMDLSLRFIRSRDEMSAGVEHYLCNYETVRDGKLDPGLFAAAALDEASVLRSYGSKTFQEFLPLFEAVRFKLVATATPSPNRTKELIHYAGFLGVMDTGQALTRFFQRNSEKAGDLTLYPHKVDEFWLWVHSWATFLQKPSDLGFSDDGYELPPLTVRWHEVPIDHSTAEPERDGQGVLLRRSSAGVREAAAAKRDSLPGRIAKMQEIIAEAPDDHRIIWHDLEAERRAIEAVVPDAVSILGAQDLELREDRLVDFEEGRLGTLATKPILSGSGSNFQYHCRRAIFLGISCKFNDFIQAVYRLQRFGQQHEVVIDIIYSEAEREVRHNLEAKWAQDTEMRQRMSELVRRYGLGFSDALAALRRSIGVPRAEAAGDGWRAVNADAVEETRRMAEDSVGLIVTSIPFGNHYEYAESYNDFGHTDDNAHFWEQMDHLTPELLRILQPGRMCCVHVKDRVLFGAVTGAGAPTISPFHAEAIFHYRRHGFDYAGMVTVVTDVVRENSQTYRLGYSEMCKDGTKMGVGSPEYILLLRKPQSDRSRGYADAPVTHEKSAYSLARWRRDRTTRTSGTMSPACGR